ncbi:MAG: hypothetical protein ABSC77_13575 [Terracidiphilus sp.]|jgi:hypothetical protein
MTEAIQTTPAPIEANEPIAASANPAVARCLDAWERANKAELAKGKSKCTASIEADQAYRRAMPPLAGSENIRDYIACVAYAMTIDAIRVDLGTKLLYAAQVAHATTRGHSAQIIPPSRDTIIP